MLTVYGDVFSGNCYKVKLLLEYLQLPYRWQAIDILEGETQTREFLTLNPNGKIPLLLLQDGRTLSESNAILGYLAENTSFLPPVGMARAKVYEWLFFEQYSHEPYIAVARFIQKYQGMPESRVDEYHSLQSGGHKALSIMEQALAQGPYLVGSTLTIADIALYAYTHVAEEGGFSLEQYPNIQAWCQRIATWPHYVALG